MTVFMQEQHLIIGQRLTASLFNTFHHATGIAKSRCRHRLYDKNRILRGLCPCETVQLYSPQQFTGPGNAVRFRSGAATVFQPNRPNRLAARRPDSNRENHVRLVRAHGALITQHYLHPKLLCLCVLPLLVWITHSRIARIAECLHRIPIIQT